MNNEKYASIKYMVTIISYFCQETIKQWLKICFKIRYNPDLLIYTNGSEMLYKIDLNGWKQLPLISFPCIKA